MTQRLALPNRRWHITQKVRVPGRTLYISVYDNPAPAEVFFQLVGEHRVKGGTDE